MNLMKRFLIYWGILLVIGGLAAYHVLTDFASTPYPPDMTLEVFHPETPGNIPEHRVWQPKYPVIDIHSHPQESGKTPDELIKIMDASGVRAIVDLDGHWGWTGHRIQRKLEEYNLKYPGRFILFTKIDFGRYKNPDFVEETLQRLEESVRWGVKGVKIWKNLGMMYRDANGKLIPLDDPRLDPIWEKIGELGIPVLIHTADPVAFWQPVDRFNERYEELTEGGSWFDSYANGDYPSFETLMKQRENLLRKHPNTIFIGAHMAELGHDLKRLGRMLDEFPNFYVDISDRAYELGRQPYTAREFFIQYQDRILFGIDLYPETHVYQDYYRFFQTEDEYFDYPRYYYKHGRWKIYGLNLPDSVLQKVYYLNAVKILQLDRKLIENPSS